MNMQTIKNLRLFFMGVMVFSLLLIHPISADDVGIAISGPLISASFDALHGQVIGSSLYLRNTGDFDTNMSTYSVITSGPVNSIAVGCKTPHFESVTPDSTVKADFNFTILNNATGVVVLTLGCISYRNIGNGSIAFAGIESKIKFLIDPNPLSLKVRVNDEFGWPVEGISIGLWKERLEYVRQSTNDNGTTSFLLSKGLYKLRVFDKGIFLQESSLNITSDRLFVFTIKQGFQISSLPTFPIIEICVSFSLGYFVRLVEKRRKKEKVKTKNEFEEMLEYCRMEIQ